MSDAYRAALAEIAAVTDRLDATAVDAACAMIADAGTVGVAGEMTAPPPGAGDLLVASAGPGEIGSMTALMRRAKGDGSRILFLTAVPDTPSAALADRVLTIPAQTMASDRGPAASATLPMGSAYEGALFVLFEVMVLTLRDRLGISLEAMRARHTNLE